MSEPGQHDDPRNWGPAREMGELEATMWRAGQHPENSTQGAVMEVFASTPDWADVRRLHVDGLQLYTRFRQRVVEPALPVGPPVWVDDDDFDLDYHLRRRTLPSPGSHRQLMQEAAALAKQELDPSRPPWVATFIEGLEGGRAAYLLVVHHCLMDGHGSVQLLSDLHGDALSRSTSASPADVSGAGTDALRLAADQAVARLGALPKVAGQAVAGVAGILRGGPVKALRFAVSAGRVLAPPAPSGSTILSGGSRTEWRFETVDCALADLKAAGKAVGGTVNDAYVAGVIGGLRIFHEKKGAEIGDVTINMPVSLRSGDDRLGGNRFVTAFIKAPSSIADPASRIQTFRAIVARVAGEPALDFFGALLPIANRAPTAVLRPLFNSMQNRTDLTITNVPGMTSAVKFAGSEVSEVYYFAPLPGCPISTVLFSYNGVCNIGVNFDQEVFGDTDELLACLQAGIDEVLDLRHRQPAPR